MRLGSLLYYQRKTFEHPYDLPSPCDDQTSRLLSVTTILLYWGDFVLCHLTKHTPAHTKDPNLFSLGLPFLPRRAALLPSLCRRLPTRNSLIYLLLSLLFSRLDILLRPRAPQRSPYL